MPVYNQGRGDNMLYPAAASTRAEAVVLVSRLLAVAKRLADVDVAVEAVLDDNSIEMKLTIRTTQTEQ